MRPGGPYRYITSTILEGNKSMNTRLSTGVVAACSVLLAGAVQIGTAGPLQAASAVAGPSGLSAAPTTSWWGTNGRVTDIKAVGSRVYLAGAFDYIGPQTGYGVPVSTSAGTVLADAPKIDGIVRSAVADGQGGFYLAGDFTRVGATYRRGAAQIDATGALTKWDPKPKGTVNSLAVLGDKVVLAGALTAIGSSNAAASGLVAVDRSRGAVVPGWSAASSGVVRSMVATDTALYVGGDFTSIGGVTATRLARLSTTTGAIDSTFAASAAGSVRGLALSGDSSTLYVGGAFTSAGGQTRQNLAAFTASNGAVTTWAPAANGAVFSVATSPVTSSVMVGGAFSTVSGTARTALAEVGATGAVTSFDARLSGCNRPHTTKNTYTMVACQPEVDAVQVVDDVVYIGGRFGRSGTFERHNAVAFAIGSSTPTAWNPVSSGLVLTIAPSTTTTFVGGDLTSVNGLVRSGLAALDSTTGAGVAAFRADTDNIALDLELAPDGKRLYVTGSFATVAGQSHTNIAAISLPSGVLDPAFVAQANNTAIVAKAAGGSVFVAGVFTKVNKVARGHLVKLSGTTGAVDPTFVANTTGPSGPLQRGGMVQGLAVRSDGSRVYAAGPFTSVNGAAVTGGITVLAGTNGARTPQQLGGVQPRCSWVAGQWITQIYLNPSETALYGGDTCPDNIYKWDAVALGTTNNPTGLSWTTWCNAGFQAGLEINGRFYYGSHGGDRNKGGYCWQSPTQRTSVARQRLTEFDSATGALTTNSYTFNSAMGVWAIESVPQGLLIGGDFSQAGGTTEPRQGLALLPGTP